MQVSHCELIAGLYDSKSGISENPDNTKALEKLRSSRMVWQSDENIFQLSRPYKAYLSHCLKRSNNRRIDPNVADAIKGIGYLCSAYIKAKTGGATQDKDMYFGELQEAVNAFLEDLEIAISALWTQVDDKFGNEDRFLKNVLIHEKIPSQRNNIVIKAVSGELKTAKIGDQLQLLLFDGNRYEEIDPKKQEDKKRIPHTRVKFERYVMNIDLSQFNNVDLSKEDYKSTFRMQKATELEESINSLEIKYIGQRKSFANNFVKTNGITVLEHVHKDSIFTDSILKKFKNPLSFINPDKFFKHKQAVYSTSISIKGVLQSIAGKKKNFFIQQKLINLHKSSFHDKYTMGFGVFFLFLIGAALGAIIRKGGLGLPVVLAILIFLSYHYIGLFGKNAAEDSSISPFVGSWVSVLIIGVFALYLTKQASSDRGLANLDRIQVPLIRFVEKIKTIKSFKELYSHVKR